MPIYEYICRRCGRGFEHLARTLSEKAPVCPACGAPAPKKQLSTFAPSSGGKSSPCADGACPSADTCPSAGCRSGKCPF